MILFLFFICSFSLLIPPLTVNMDFNGSLNGLIRRLQQNYPQIENSGILQISSSSYYPGWIPKNVLYDDDTGFCTNINAPGEFLQFDFLKNFISLDSYTIKPRSGYEQSKNWKVSGSIDGITWTIIDEVIENVDMCSNQTPKSFIIKDKTNFRFIRFLSTGQRCGHTGIYFNVFLIEFFGRINLKFNTIMKKTSFFNILLLLIFFFLK